MTAWLLVTSKELEGDEHHLLLGRQLPGRWQQRGMTSVTASPAQSKWKTEWVDGSHTPVLQRGTGSRGSTGRQLRGLAAACCGEPACGVSSSARSRSAAGPFQPQRAPAVLQRGLMRVADEKIKMEPSSMYVLVRANAGVAGRQT